VVTRTVLNQRQRSQFLTRLVWATIGGEGIDGYVLGTIGAAMSLIKADLRLSSWQEGLLGAAALIGIFLGSPFFGRLTDRFGRKPMFTVDILVFVVGSLLQMVACNWETLFLVRLLMGVAIGGEYSVGGPLLGEFSPSAHRGRTMGNMMTAWYVGYLAGWVLGYAFEDTDPSNWRWVLGSSFVPAVVVMLLRIGTPESPYWLAEVGRRAEAEEIVRKYGVEMDLGDPSSEPARAGFRELKRPEYRRATVFTCLFWSTLVAPYFAIGTFAPQVLAALGLDAPLAITLATNGIAVAGVVVGTLIVDRIGRRALLIPQFWITSAAFLVLAAWHDAPIAVVVGMFSIFSFLNPMASPLCAIYPAEVFPTQVRTTGTGVASAASRIGAATGTYLVPSALTGIGVGWTMFIGALVLLAGAVASQLMAPETTGLELNKAARQDKPDELPVTTG
jgi:putative MFS transporter